MSKDLCNAIVDLKPDQAMDIVKSRLAESKDPLAILDDCRKGMDLVGERFQAGEYFLSELMLSADLFKTLSEELEPHLMRVRTSEPLGKVVLATMRGDVHDLGKDIFATLLRVQSFDVHDLGVNVEPALLVEKVEQIRPEFVAFSMLISTAFESTKRAVDLLEKAGLRDGVRVMVGGGVTTPGLKDYLHADFQTLDGAEGVAYCVESLKGA